MSEPTRNIRELELDDIAQAVRLLALLNPETPEAVLAERLREILDSHPHYLAIGAFEEGRMLGLAGAWLATKIWCGRYLEIDNLVIDPDCRSSGLGSALISRLEGMGRERDCRILVLDSYTGNHASHRLYHRLGFEIWGFHFIKPIGDWKGNGGE